MIMCVWIAASFFIHKKRSDEFYGKSSQLKVGRNLFYIGSFKYSLEQVIFAANSDYLLYKKACATLKENGRFNREFTRALWRNNMFLITEKTLISVSI